MNNVFLGIDIGGSLIKAGYGSAEQGLIAFHTIPNTANDRLSLYKLVESIVTMMLTDINDNYPVKGLGIGSPGIIDTVTGKIIGNSPNINEWAGANLKDYLERSLSLAVFQENDADLMTYGESYANGRAGKCILGITIGTGIGSGFVNNGKIYHSCNKSAIELGHCIIDPYGINCLCGKRGCLETISSVKAILRQISKATGENISLDQAIELYRQNIDPFPEIINRAIDKLALATANAVTLLGADIVVVGGGITEISSFNIAPLKQKILEHLKNSYYANISIETASMKNKAAVWGGILLAQSSV